MKKSLISTLVVAALAMTPGVAFAADGTEASNAPLTCTDTQDLTILATTDNHGTALNYDYFTGNTFTNGEINGARGLELLSTAIKDIRAERGEESVLVVDNGDNNQGNPLETVYHKERGAGTVDPMASALNYIGYDVGIVGNHEFNYGLEDLQQYKDNLNFPLLAANFIDKATGKPYLDPYTIIEKKVGETTVKIGVIGVDTPGVRIWDGPRTQNIDFQDTVDGVNKWVPVVKAEGADVVVVLAHTGIDADSYTWNPADLSENAARSIAENTSGVDVIVAGHSHVTDAFNKFYTNKDGEQVLLSQPGYHARFLSDIKVPLSITDEGVSVVNTTDCHPNATPVYASNYVGREDAGISATIKDWHEKTVEWVSTVVAQSTEELSAATSAWEDTPIVDFINKVQTDAVTAGLAGTQYEDIPVLSEASPFSRTAVFSKGDVDIADMAALYIYDNTLFGSLMTGKEIKEYLEHSARYYIQQEPGAVVSDWASVTNASYDGMALKEGKGIPDYSYDVLSGVNYHINISKPVGERIENLSHPDGTPVKDTDRFILAVNNYRQSGGSGYPNITAAPVVYDRQESVRDLMIDWAIAKKTIDPKDFFVKNWTVSTSSVLAPVDNDKDPVTPGKEEKTDPDDKTGNNGQSSKTENVAGKQDPRSLAYSGADVSYGIAAFGMIALGGLFLAVRRRSSQTIN